jgi:basic membrane protein A
MKRFLGLVLAMLMVLGLLVGCGKKDNTADTPKPEPEATAPSVKVGVIYIGDENEGYTGAHMAGIDAMMKNLGLKEDQVIEKTNIKEDESAYDAAVDLAEQGANVIIANSFGHEDYIIQAAKEYPDIQFLHDTGFKAKSSGLANMHNAFNAIYEARYVAGVVAGLKINEMIESGKITKDKAKIGYVGAYPFAEVVSGYTSFYLGAKSVSPTVTMDVQYTNSWSDMAGEKEVATQLIANGAVLISQHADTTGAPTAAEAKGVPCVGYNVDMISVAPNSALTSAAMNWSAYYTYAVKSVIDGKPIDTDWCQGLKDEAVAITALNDKVVAKGTSEKVKEVEDTIKTGTLHVFDTKTFTIGGKSIEELIKSDTNYAKYADYIKDGYFHESELIAAPAFDLRIDGIKELTK